MITRLRQRLVDLGVRLWRPRLGSHPVPHLIIHAVLPTGTGEGPDGVSSVAATVGTKQVRVVRADDGPYGPADLLRRAVPRMRRPVRAVVISSERALGADDTIGADELRRLRPGAEAAIASIVAAVPAERVTVALDLPSADELLGAVISGSLVDAGKVPSDLGHDVLVGVDLAERLGSVHGVDEVLLLDEPSPIERAWRILAITGAEAPKRVTALKGRPGRAWTLRGLMASVAASPHLDSGERRLVNAELRDLTSAEPARSPAVLASRGALEAGAYAAPSGPLGIRELHLHVGIQKTATTTVQAAMTAARQQLAEAGVVYVDRADMMRLPDVRAWGAYRATGTASFDRFANQLQAAVRRRQRASEAAERPSDVVFISNETFVGAIERGPFLERPFRPRTERALFEILDVLQPESCRLSLVTRRQDTLVESMYMWQLHGGESFSFDRYMKGVRRHPEALFYTDLSTRLESMVGVSSLWVRPFETIKAGLDGFLNSLLVPMGVTVDFDAVEFTERANPSYSAQAMDIARAMNPHLTRKKEVVRVREFLRKTFPIGDYEPAQLLTDEARAELLTDYTEDNTDLFRRWMPDQPEDMYH